MIFSWNKTDSHSITARSGSPLPKPEDPIDNLERNVFLGTHVATLATFSSCTFTASTPLVTLMADSLCATFNVSEDYEDPAEKVSVGLSPAINFAGYMMTHLYPRQAR